MNSPARPLRIIFVAKGPPVDYTTSDAYFALPDWLSRHSEMVLACPRPDGRKQIPFENNLAGLHYLKPGFRHFPSAARELGRLAVAHQSDVVMTGVDEFSLLPGLYAGIQRGCPVIAVCEDHPFWSRYHEPKNPIRRLEGIIRTQVLGLLLRRPAQILCFIEKDVLDFLELPPAKLTQMRNGVNDTLLSLREKGGPAVPYSIGYIGGVEELKGSLDMLEILVKIRRRGIPGTLILVGPFDSKENSRVFQRRSEELGVAEAVRVTGYVPHMEALKLLRTCTVCIHAYRPLPWLYYNQVLKLAEYMALGKAVVSWDYPGARRMLDRGRSGALVKYGDLDRMVERVAELLTNDELRRGFEKSGYETVADRFVWSKIGQNVVEIIAEVVARNGKRSCPDRVPLPASGG